LQRQYFLLGWPQKFAGFSSPATNFG